MANSIPVQRSYQQILADIISAFLAKQGIPNLKVGSPILSILEAAAQSDTRQSQDVINMLKSVSLDTASDIALDRKAADENLQRFSQTPSFGTVVITDTSFTKLSTKIYQGTPAPIVGSTTINVADASKFPGGANPVGTNPHNIYIGRGSSDFEGPLTYTAGASNPQLQAGGYWTITLNSSTQNFHNQGESVVLGQGGNRTVNSSTIVQTPQGNATSAVTFATLFTATLPDGETQITNVAVSAQQSGSITNVPANSITQFATLPFTGATVTNPLPFSNGQDLETDDSLRERVRNARQTRTQGTTLAITNGAIGVISPDENKRVLSANLVAPQGSVSTLYIDDGTGYEEVSTGNPLEVVVDSASGGEQYLQLASARPVTKANVVSTIVAPYNIVAGSTLTVLVGGIPYQHTFSATDFRSPSNATAYEIVSSINADPNIQFGARTSGSGMLVVLFALSDTNEDIQVIPPLNVATIDANLALGFPAGKSSTLRLYKNDILLSKDGQQAIIISQTQPNWSSMASGETLSINVDNTGVTTYTFLDGDFVSNNTGYTTLSNSNSLASWATVLTNKITGITVTAGAGVLTVTSNSGLSSHASLSITGGSLVSKGMFSANTSTGLASTGRNNDYTLNRNTDQIRLNTSLSALDRLTAGSTNTRAFLQSSIFNTVNLSSNTATFWFAYDSGAKIITTGLGPSTTLTFSYPGSAIDPNTVRITANTAIFQNIQVGDWAIFWDGAFGPSNQGAWRVSNIDPSFNYFDIERTALTNVQTSLILTSSGLTFARTTFQLQRVLLPTSSNLYTANSLQSTLATLLMGSGASVYRTNQVRINTDTYGKNGDIALLAADINAQLFGIPSGNPVVNLTSHIASAETATRRFGTPNFLSTGIVATTIAAGSNGQTLPFATINVATSGTTGFPGTGVFEVVISGAPQYVTYTGTSGGNQFTGCTGGSGTLATGQTVLPVEYSTTVAAGSNGQALPQTTVNVASTANFPTTGTFAVIISAGNPQFVTYTGLTSTSFTGCSGGVGTLATNQAVYPVNNSTELMLTVAPSTIGMNSGSRLLLKRDLPFSASVTRFTTNDNYDSAIQQILITSSPNTYTITPRTPALYEFLPNTKLYAANPWAISPEDTLSVLIDQNTTSKRYSFNMYRNLTTVGTTYGTTNTFKDGDNGNASLVSQFGNSFNFNDFIVHMHARAKSHPSSVSNQTALWRYFRYGPDGNFCQVAFGYPVAASTPVAVITTDTDVDTTSTSNGFVDVYINLPSAAARSTPNIRNSTRVGIAAAAGPTNNLQTISYYLGFTVASGSAVRTGGNTVTITFAPAGITDVGFATGNQVYINTNSDPNFSSGVKILTRTSGLVYTYTEAGSNVSSANQFTVSYDVGEATTSGVQANDIFTVTSSSSLPTSLQQTSRVVTLATQSWTSSVPETAGGISSGTVVTWYPLNITTALSFYPIDTGNNQISQIVTAVNNLANAANSMVPITGVTGAAIGNNGTGVISRATWDEIGTYPSFYLMTDGVNYVQSQSVGSDYQFTFKDPLGNANLATNSDWADEKLRITPSTDTNQIAWLTTPAVSGLFSSANVLSSSNASKLQIATLTPGSVGSVQVQGNTANSVSATVLGSASPISAAPTYSIVQTDKLSSVGLTSGMWVKAVNTNTITKAQNTGIGNAGNGYVIGVNTSLDSITAAGLFSLDSGTGAGNGARAWSFSGPISPNTFITSGSNGLALPQATINVNSTTGFSSSGSFVLLIGNSVQTIAYTGTSGGNQFTGCTGGTGTMATNQAVIAESNTWMIEKTGQFVSYTWNGLGTTPNLGGGPDVALQEGDNVIIFGTNNPLNSGTYRVVRIDTTNQTFWIQNPNAVEEITPAAIQFIAYDSIMPGDSINISTTLWNGTGSNVGLWKIASIGGATPYNNQFQFTVTVPTGTTLYPVSVSTPGLSLGTNYPLVQVIEGAPSTLIKQIRTITYNQSNTNAFDVMFSSYPQTHYISNAAGTLLQPLDKFGFPTTLQTGIDGYAHSTGLIAEVNRVEYGDPRNPSNYPGIIAAGANINISGPLVKRVQVSLGVRVAASVFLNGATTGPVDVANKVKGQVATYINSFGIGQSIPISGIIAQAEMVNGVASVTVLSPTYGPGTDLITIQPFQKPLVLNIDQDVTITFIGT